MTPVQRAAGVEQLVVEDVRHSPAGAAGGAHQVRLAEPAGHGGHVLVHGVEGVEHRHLVQVAHPAILRPGTDTGPQAPTAGSGHARYGQRPRGIDAAATE